MGDRSGKTPLHHAAYMGHAEMVALLLVKGANVKAADKKERTALHFASVMGERRGGEGRERRGGEGRESRGGEGRSE